MNISSGDIVEVQIDEGSEYVKTVFCRVIESGLGWQTFSIAAEYVKYLKPWHSFTYDDLGSCLIAGPSYLTSNKAIPGWYFTLSAGPLLPEVTVNHGPSDS